MASEGTEKQKVKCPSCNVPIAVPASAAGRNGKCPRCGEMFRVPAPKVIASAAQPEPAGPVRVYYVLRGAKRFGPFSVAQLKNLVSSQKISPDDLIVADNMPDRPVVAKNVKGLFAGRVARTVELASQAVNKVKDTNDETGGHESRFSSKPDSVRPMPDWFIYLGCIPVVVGLIAGAALGLVVLYFVVIKFDLISARFVKRYLGTAGFVCPGAFFGAIVFGLLWSLLGQYLYRSDRNKGSEP